jgi:hypothetical protein
MASAVTGGAVGLSDEFKQQALDWFDSEYKGAERRAQLRVVSHFADWQEVLLHAWDSETHGAAAERIDPQRQPRLARLALEKRTHSAGGSVAEKIDPVASPDLAKLALEVNDPPISCRAAENIDPLASPDLAEIALKMDVCIARYVGEKLDPQEQPELAKLAFKAAERAAERVAADGDSLGAWAASVRRDAIRTARAMAERIDLDRSKPLARMALRSPYPEIALAVAERINPQTQSGLAKTALERLRSEDIGRNFGPDQAAAAVVRNIDPPESPELARIVLLSGIPGLALVIAEKIDPQAQPDLAKIVLNMPITIQLPFLVTREPFRRDLRVELAEEGIKGALAVVEKIDPEKSQDLVQEAMYVDDPEVAYRMAARVDPTLSDDRALRQLTRHRPVPSKVPTVKEVLSRAAKQPAAKVVA